MCYNEQMKAMVKLVIVVVLLLLGVSLWTPLLHFTDEKFTESFQVRAAWNDAMSELEVGTKLKLQGEEFVKANDDNLLSLAGTYTCSTGRQIAGEWVKCVTCPAGSSWNTSLGICECETGTTRGIFINFSREREC